ncbi:MAG: hypothetical protein V4590_13310 [Bacteroidota bacterium]
MILKNSILYALMALAIVSCKKEEGDDTTTPTPQTLTVPSFYDSSSYISNIQPVTSVRTQMDALVTEIKKGRVTANTLTASGVNTIYTTGAVSVQSITSAFYNTELTATGGWFETIATASGNTYHPDSTSVNGGTFGGYLFDENGFEPEQLIEKGLFGAALMNKAAGLISGSTVTQQQIDQSIYIFGASPSFVNSGTAAKYGTSADKYFANYTSRRDKNDGTGYYTKMAYNYMKLQAAVKAGSTFDGERNNAVATIKLSWEKANAGTVINYCYSSLSKLTATTMTDADKASSLHAINECIGFVKGWKSLTNGKLITDTQIDEVYALLAPNNKPSLFITDRVNKANNLQLAITKLQTIYGFTAGELEDFKKNWVAEQSR